MCYESVLTVCIVPQVCSDGSAFQSGVFPPCTSGKPKCEDDTVKPTCADGQVGEERNDRVMAMYLLWNNTDMAMELICCTTLS